MTHPNTINRSDSNFSYVGNDWYGPVSSSSYATLAGYNSNCQQCTNAPAWNNGEMVVPSMAVQAVPVWGSKGYDALSHGRCGMQCDNNCGDGGYFNIQCAYPDFSADCGQLAARGCADNLVMGPAFNNNAMTAPEAAWGANRSSVARSGCGAARGRSPGKGRSPRRMPRSPPPRMRRSSMRSPGRRSPGRRSPVRRSPQARRSSMRSPQARRSSMRSPQARRSSMRSPSRRSPSRRSPRMQRSTSATRRPVRRPVRRRPQMSRSAAHSPRRVPRRAVCRR